MTTDPLEREIRRAVQAEALACEPPEDLAERTLARARERELSPARRRFGTGATGRVAGGRTSRPVRWGLSGAAALLALVFFFAVGSLFTSGSVLPGGPTAPQLVRPRGTGPETGAAQEQGREASRPVPGLAQPGQTPAEDAPGGLPFEPPAPSGGTPRVARTADVELRVPEGAFGDRWRRANAIAGEHGGFVTRSSAEEVEGKLARGSLTLQVPADKLDAALAGLRQLGTPVELTTSATDVSGQLVDYEARLRAARANEAQLLELLRQARSFSDALAVRPQLQEVRREIETLEAQRASLQGRVDLASVTALLYEREAAPPSPSTGRIAVALRRAGDAATATIAGMIIVAGYLGPLVAVGAAVWLLTRVLRRRLV